MISIESLGHCVDRRRILTAALASLPRSYALASSAEASANAGKSPLEPGSVAAVCSGDDWTGHVAVAIAAGYRAVIVIDPGGDDPDMVQRLAADSAEAAVPVVLARRWASNPALAAERVRELPDELGTRLLIDSQVNFAGPSLRDALCAQFDVLQALYGEPVTIESWSSGDVAYVVAGRLDPAGQDTPVQLVGARTTAAPGGVRVRELLSHGTRTLRFFDGDSARPGEVVLSGPAGQLQRPTIYETGYRAALLTLRDELAGRRPSAQPSDLDRYAAMLAAVPRGL